MWIEGIRRAAIIDNHFRWTKKSQLVWEWNHRSKDWDLLESLSTLTVSTLEFIINWSLRICRNRYSPSRAADLRFDQSKSEFLSHIWRARCMICRYQVLVQQVHLLLACNVFARMAGEWSLESAFLLENLEPLYLDFIARTGDCSIILSFVSNSVSFPFEIFFYGISDLPCKAVRVENLDIIAIGLSGIVPDV